MNELITIKAWELAVLIVVCITLGIFGGFYISEK